MMTTLVAGPSAAQGDEPASDDCLSIDLIRRSLSTEVLGYQMDLWWEVPSTSEVLQRLAEAGAREGTVVLAEAERAERGRRDGHLHVSVLFRPRIPAPAVAGFSLIAALALSDAMWAEGLPASITRRNDVVIDGRVAATCRVAYAAVGEDVRYVIVGVAVGVNAALDRTQDTTCLMTEADRPIDRNAFAAAFLNHLEKWWAAHRATGPQAVLRAWRSRVAAGPVNPRTKIVE